MGIVYAPATGRRSQYVGHPCGRTSAWAVGLVRAHSLRLLLHLPSLDDHSVHEPIDLVVHTTEVASDLHIRSYCTLYLRDAHVDDLQIRRLVDVSGYRSAHDYKRRRAKHHSLCVY